MVENMNNYLMVEESNYILSDVFGKITHMNKKLTSERFALLYSVTDPLCNFGALDSKNGADEAVTI